MNIGNKQLDLKVEKAVRLLVEYIPEEKDRQKNILTHALRVGMYLYDNDYSEDVVIAGLLHDIVEWTDGPKDVVENEFGKHVLDIVLANTKDRSIGDKTERRKDMIERCSKTGIDALVVKATDTLDSHLFYQSINDLAEIQRAVDIGRIILSVITNEMADPIFEKLKELS
jgi:guanosine-3',5'-bis(diphosphate) 3'-pyrophosphohydrolase